MKYLVKFVFLVTAKDAGQALSKAKKNLKLKKDRDPVYGCQVSFVER